MHAKVEQARQGAPKAAIPATSSPPGQAPPQASVARALARRHGVPLIVNDDSSSPSSSARRRASGPRRRRSWRGARSAFRPDPRRLLLQRRELAPAGDRGGRRLCRLRQRVPSPTKPAAVRAPLALFATALEVPLCAIGGITLDNAPQVIEPVPISSPWSPICSTRRRYQARAAQYREGSSHEETRISSNARSAHSGRREFSGARLPRRRRHAAVLRARLGRSPVGRRRPALHRLPRLVGTDGPRPPTPRWSRRCRSRLARPFLRRADRRPRSSSPSSCAGWCQRSRWCASCPRAPRPP